ncbi:MAG TPA: adenosylcobinamide-phosphate synthase CbiB, partial [Nitrospira sp.]
MTGGDLLIAAAVDAAVGDPRWLPHPVRGMGLVISWGEERIRLFCKSSMSLRVAGFCLAIGLPVVVYVIGSFVIEQAESISALCGQAAGIALASTTLAWRDLWNHAMTVTRELAGRNIPGARQAVGMIVGRDTASLSEAEIVRATVETIAESAADGVIAPLVYLTLGGAPLALAYKAINTLDSMIGHRDERYADFGWASARLDDLANWIPARLTAGFMVLTAGLATGKWERTIESWRILLRDGAKHPSPNSGRPEAAMAGALGVQLGGTNYYDGLA